MSAKQELQMLLHAQWRGQLMKQWEHLHLVLAYHLACNEKQTYMYTYCKIISSHAPQYHKENHKSIISC